MKIHKVTNIEQFVTKILPKQPQNNKSIVESILKNVQKNGDSSIKKYEKKFTGAKLSSLRVSKSEIKNAYSKISKNELSALRLAKARVEKTESVIKNIFKDKKINHDGIKILKKFIPIQSAGCYIPGGLARYPSSVIMSVVPAKVAGVKRIVVVSPPNSNGKIDPLTIVAADICGATEIYKTGGVQSIAALSYGTKSILKVDKIVGPGGAFVTLAKSLVNDNTGIDMLAGPTELGIISDNSVNPEFLALDLISQAEHSSDTFCYLITNSEKIAKLVNEKISKLFKHKNIDISKAKSSVIFDKNCQVGEKITLTSKDKCTVMIAAPGEAMSVHEQNPPTDLTVFLNKSKFEESEEQFFLPFLESAVVFRSVSPSPSQPGTCYLQRFGKRKKIQKKI